MWLLTMGLLALIIIKSNHQFVLKIIAVIVCCILTHYADWSYTVPLWIAGFGVFYKKPLLQFVSFTVTGVVFYIVPMILRHGIDHITFSTLYIMGIFIAIPLILQYSGERGNRSKTIGIVFYVYYPVHLMLLYLVNVLNIY